MLQPARRKYRKEQKGRNKGVATSGAKVAFGEFGRQRTLEVAGIGKGELLGIDGRPSRGWRRRSAFDRRAALPPDHTDPGKGEPAQHSPNCLSHRSAPDFRDLPVG